MAVMIAIYACIDNVILWHLRLNPLWFTARPVMPCPVCPGEAAGALFGPVAYPETIKATETRFMPVVLRF